MSTETTTTFDATRLTRLARVGEIAASPDGAWLAVVVARLDADDARYVSDLYRVPTGGGPAVRLTRGPSKDTTPRFRRDGALGFLSNRNPRDGAAQPGDDDRMQVWLLPADGGEAAPLTDEPLGVTDFELAADADAMVVLAEVELDVPLDQMRARARDRAEHGPSALHYREAPLRHWDAWLPATSLHAILYDDRGGGRRDLTPTARHHLRNGPGDPGVAISADGARIAVTWSELGADRVPDGWIRVIDVATSAAVDLGRAAETSHGTPRFGPGGRLAAQRVVRRSCLGEIVRLVAWEPGGDPAGRVIAPDWDAHPTLHAWTDDGALLATADHEGASPVYRVAWSGEVVRITAPEAGGTHEHVRPLPGRVAGVRHRLLQPPEPFVCELAGDATPRSVASLTGLTEADAAAIARWTTRWTPGDGGAPVQWFLVEPAAAAGPTPLLLWIHGGPVGAFGDGWHWRWSPLVAAAAGYAVALPNPRGSTGYGQAFIDGVYGNTWGGACYRDLVAVVDDAARLPTVDGARIAAMGGSFGGYMANWIGTQTERFRALVSHAGLFHLGGFYGATDYPGYMSCEFGGHPFGDDVATFRRYSPDAHAMGWRTPVLFLHGDKDYRVPITEALIAFEAVKLAGAHAELVVFPDENHWIQRPRNIRAWYQAWLAFVARHL
jgi:dipeptidyl aminopeptidase/acylaminoacyl peptidase